MSNDTINAIKKFIQDYDEIEKLTQNSYKSQADVDKELSIWYHKVEGFTPTHVSQSHALLKEVKDILERRRAIKLEVNLLKLTCDNVGIKITQLKSKLKTTVVKHNQLLEDLKTNAKK